MLRPIPLTKYLGTLTSLGFDERDLLANTKINPAAMQDPHYLVSFGQYLRLFENASCFNSYPGVGLEFGLRSGIEDSGVLGYATLSCRSVRQSMEELWARYGAALGMMASPRFQDNDPKSVAIEFSVPSMSEAAYRLCIEDALCRIATTGTSLVGSKAAFEKVFLSYSAPEYAERYRQIFQCPIMFNAPETRVIIKRDWMEQPLKTQDEALLGVYLRHLGQLDQNIKNATPIIDQTRECLMRCESAALPSQVEVAKKIGLSGRTLCRSLQKHGSSYRSLVEEVRIERALMSFDSGRITAREIAHQAGYQNLSAFRRAFKKWTDQTVQEYQKGKERRARNNVPLMPSR